LLHAFCAELNLGLPVMPGVTLTATFTSLPLVVTFGSGKSGTPCSRIHAEYATAWLSGEAEPLCELPALEDPLCELPAFEEELLEEVLDPRCATVGVFAPPPQPAPSNASAVIPTISPIAFISSSPRAGWMLRARLFYGTAGYTTVTAAVTAL
jgi:hypothetical protein